MFQYVSPDAVPQQFHRAFIAIRRSHAGAAEFEKFQIAVASNEGSDIEFAGAVESARSLRDVLTQQSIGADDRRRSLPLSCPVIDDQEMVAYRVEKVDVSPREIQRRVCDRRHLLVEHVVPQLLGPADFRRRAGKPDFKRAEPAEGRKTLGVAVGGANSAVGLQYRNQFADEAQRRVDPACRPARHFDAGKHGDFVVPVSPVRRRRATPRPYPYNWLRQSDNRHNAYRIVTARGAGKGWFGCFRGLRAILAQAQHG